MSFLSPLPPSKQICNYCVQNSAAAVKSFFAFLTQIQHKNYNGYVKINSRNCGWIWSFGVSIERYFWCGTCAPINSDK